MIKGIIRFVSRSSAGIVHYRKSHFCCVHQSLPCASSRAHGKHQFCQVSSKNTRQNKSTRQSHALPCAFFSHGKEILCCVFLFDTRQSLTFAMCFILAHGKVINFFCLLTSKLFLLFTYNMWYSILKFDIFLYLFIIFN